MEKNIIVYCFIALLSSLFSIIMYLIMKYKSSDGSKKIVKRTFLFVILMNITSIFVYVFSIYYIVESELGLDGILKGLL